MIKTNEELTEDIIMIIRESLGSFDRLWHDLDIYDRETVREKIELELESER